MSQHAVLGTNRPASQGKLRQRPAFVLTETVLVLGMIAASIVVMSPAVHFAGQAARQAKLDQAAQVPGGKLARYRGNEAVEFGQPLVISSGLCHGPITASFLKTGSWAQLLNPTYDDATNLN